MRCRRFRQVRRSYLCRYTRTCVCEVARMLARAHAACSRHVRRRAPTHARTPARAGGCAAARSGARALRGPARARGRAVSRQYPPASCSGGATAFTSPGGVFDADSGSLISPPAAAAPAVLAKRCVLGVERLRFSCLCRCPRRFVGQACRTHHMSGCITLVDVSLFDVTGAHQFACSQANRKTRFISASS